MTTVIKLEQFLVISLKMSKQHYDSIEFIENTQSQVVCRAELRISLQELVESVDDFLKGYISGNYQAVDLATFELYSQKSLVNEVVSEVLNQYTKRPLKNQLEPVSLGQSGISAELHPRLRKLLKIRREFMQLLRKVSRQLNDS